MNRNYYIVSKILKDNVSAAAGINSYESLPTRNSPRTLITSRKDDKKTEQDCDAMDLNKMHKALTNEEISEDEDK